MRVFQIQKSPGKFRTIYAPSLEEKAVFRSALGDIARKARRMGPGTSHGFERGRSPVSNALQHVGHKYLLKIDL